MNGQLLSAGSALGEAGKANYAINPTPELYLRSNRALLPARVIAALGLHLVLTAAIGGMKGGTSANFIFRLARVNERRAVQQRDT